MNVSDYQSPVLSAVDTRESAVSRPVDRMVPVRAHVAARYTPGLAFRVSPALTIRISPRSVSRLRMTVGGPVSGDSAHPRRRLALAVVERRCRPAPRTASPHIHGTNCLGRGRRAGTRADRRWLHCHSARRAGRQRYGTPRRSGCPRRRNVRRPRGPNCAGGPAGG